MYRPKVAIVGTVGLPARYGGFETLAHFLVLHLGEQFDFTVYCSGPDYPEHPATYLSAKLKYVPFRANGAQSIICDLYALLDSCLHADVILVLGVSGGVFLPFIRLAGKKIVLNVGGLDWQRSKWSKSASRFLKISEAVAIRSAKTLISDNEGIQDYFERTYRRSSTLIEYGGDQITSPPITEELRQRYPCLSGPYAFSVARIQPDNNIEMILEAFAKASQHEFVMVGNWASSDFGRQLKQLYAVSPNIHILEAIYDPQVLNVLRGNCSVYVHGHSAGGTNPSLVEAMHLSLPIAAFDVVYNRATTENGAQYFASADELALLLDRVAPEEWESQRANMKEIANRRYRWTDIAARYAVLLSR